MSQAFLWEQAVPLFLWIFSIFSNEAEYMQKLIKDKRIAGGKSYNITCRYTDDVLSINNQNFTNQNPLIYIIQTAQLLPLPYILILSSNLTSIMIIFSPHYSKKDDFYFAITDFSHLDSNSMLGIYISQPIIRVTRGYSLYSDFLQLRRLLSNNQFKALYHLVFPFRRTLSTPG